MKFKVGDRVSARLDYPGSSARAGVIIDRFMWNGRDPAYWISFPDHPDREWYKEVELELLVLDTLASL